VGREKILIIHHNEELEPFLVKQHLDSHNLHVDFVSGSALSQESSFSVAPSLIIISDKVLEKGGVYILEVMRTNPLICSIPILMIGSSHNRNIRIRALRAGATGFIPNPFDGEEVIALVRSSLYQAELSIPRSSLTGLSSEVLVEKEVECLIQEGKLFALAYMSIDNFRTFCHKYGFSHGDNILIEFANLLRMAQNIYGDPDDCLAQQGTEYFLYFSTPKKLDKICQYIIQVFDTEFARLHYDNHDLERGYMAYRHRQGRWNGAPLLSLAIGVSSNENREILGFRQALHIAIELQDKAREGGKSSYLKDRRVG
jgi:PleD family two-component response regulator